MSVIKMLFESSSTHQTVTDSLLPAISDPKEFTSYIPEINVLVVFVFYLQSEIMFLKISAPWNKSVTFLIFKKTQPKKVTAVHLRGRAG